jgi:hypothetical protein
MKQQSTLRRWAVVMPMLLATLMMSGCTVTQAKINTAVTDIANWTPIISTDATALLTDIASFTPSDAVQINKFVATMQTDSAALTALCKQYLASPSSSLLTQIAALVSTLATTDSGALLAVLQIKDANSQNIARGILTTIATALTILSGYLASVHVAVTPAATQALNQMKPYLNRAALAGELQIAKNQGLVPQNMTLAQAGF